MMGAADRFILSCFYRNQEQADLKLIIQSTFSIETQKTMAFLINFQAARFDLQETILLNSIYYHCLIARRLILDILWLDKMDKSFRLIFKDISADKSNRSEELIVGEQLMFKIQAYNQRNQDNSQSQHFEKTASIAYFICGKYHQLHQTQHFLHYLFLCRLVHLRRYAYLILLLTPSRPQTGLLVHCDFLPAFGPSLKLGHLSVLPSQQMALSMLPFHLHHDHQMMVSPLSEAERRYQTQWILFQVLSVKDGGKRVSIDKSCGRKHSTVLVIDYEYLQEAVRPKTVSGQRILIMIERRAVQCYSLQEIFLSKSRPVQLVVCVVSYSGTPPHFSQTKEKIIHSCPRITVYVYCHTKQGGHSINIFLLCTQRNQLFVECRQISSLLILQQGIYFFIQGAKDNSD